MLSITVTGNTTEELTASLSLLSAMMAGGTPAAFSTTAQAAAPAAEKGTRGKGKDKAADARAAVGSTATVTEPKNDTIDDDPLGDNAGGDDPLGEGEAEETYTVQDVKNVLVEVKEHPKGLGTKVVELLKEHGGVPNLTSLKEEKYGAVVNAAKAWLKKQK